MSYLFPLFRREYANHFQPSNFTCGVVGSKTTDRKFEILRLSFVRIPSRRYGSALNYREEITTNDDVIDLKNARSFFVIGRGSLVLKVVFSPLFEIEKGRIEIIAAR